MRILAVINDKGGSCKTTTAVSLAAALAESGKRTLLVDLDPQGRATNWLLGAKHPAHEGWARPSPSLHDVLVKGRPIADSWQETLTPGVELIQGTPALSNLEEGLSGKARPELALQDALRDLPEEEWDFVFVDCPPTLGFLSISALAACDEVLIPVEASAMAVGGFAHLFDTVERVRSSSNEGLWVTGVLLCRIDARTRICKAVMSHMRVSYRRLIFKSVIRESVRFREAPAWGKPITTYAPRSHGAEDYRGAAKELLRRKNRTIRPTRHTVPPLVILTD